MEMKSTENLFNRTLLTCMVMFFALILSAQNLGGSVQDEHGEPIIGASIVVKGQSGGAITDLDGNFTIQCKAGASITVSYVGFIPQDMKAKDGMQIVLKEDVAQLNEVVVVGYGS